MTKEEAQVAELLNKLRVDELNPLWLGVIEVLKEEEGMWTDALLSADLTSESRHYNAGGAAAIRQAIDTLNQMRLKANA